MRADVITVLRSWAPEDRRRQVLLVLVQLLASFFDLVGLAALFPLMQVLTGEDLSSGYLGKIWSLLGEPSRQVLVLELAAGVMLAFLTKALFSLRLQWWSLGFNNRMIAQTQQKLLQHFLAEDYLAHRRRNTAEIARALGQSVSDGVGRVIGGLASLATQVLSVLVIISLLLVTMPVPTLVAIVYFAITMLLIDRLLVNPNKSAGLLANQAGARLSKAMLQAVGAFREVKMHRAEGHFLHRYADANKQVQATSRRVNFLAQVPKQVLEVVTIWGMAILLIVISLTASDPGAMMPSLTLFVAAAMKILPTLSGMSATIGNVNYGRAGLAITADLLRQPLQRLAPESSPEGSTARAGSLEVDDVTFSYPDGHTPVLNGVSLNVPAGTSLAIVGSSGAGKTTLVDIILGLIEPTTGNVRYGGTPITDFEWSQMLAYVPQDVYILDESILENVAFGVEPDQADEARVWDALRAVQMDSLVRDLPRRLHSGIGERGSRLSGGQRQRLGIARALYRAPNVLVLDEATSALDNETEHHVAKAVEALRGRVTTLIVAHRLSTVRSVDQLVFLEDGRVSASGTFAEVREQSAAFNRLVELGSLDAPAQAGSEVQADDVNS
ncbi:ABC transporter ATP-binding protein [Aestuariimicrobium ganziense]|uniref:ABC transporter ATP-binding protein n=1 Tax=Aestuariimicrobium ganziense TaxID=2773677 RepID=UPI00194333D9|nr:ABC transporter ATP-binding protein [Aestuariimicrobium ganziense]